MHVVLVPILVGPVAILLSFVAIVVVLALATHVLVPIPFAETLATHDLVVVVVFVLVVCH